MGADPQPQLGEQPPFDLRNALIRIEDFPLVFLELRRGESLGVDEGLFPLEIRRSQVKIRLRDFNVIAKDLVVADFERSDSGAFALPLFHRGDDLLAVLRELAQLVELGVVARADHSGIGCQRGRIVGDGALDALAHVGQFV